MDYTQSARNRFAGDKYATEATGVFIEDVDVNYAKCSLTVKPCHLNAMGFVMGGAVFTLADLAFAVAASTDNPNTVSLNSQINYMNATKGPVLYAEAKCTKNGKIICLFEINITDGDGNRVANVTTTGFRKQ